MHNELIRPKVFRQRSKVDLNLTIDTAVFYSRASCVDILKSKRCKGNHCDAFDRRKMYKEAQACRSALYWDLPTVVFNVKHSYTVYNVSIVHVRYHCGEWSEEVNSCILISYMVYL